MKEICQFEINNRIYTIYNVKKLEGKNSYVGRSNYETREICIEENTPEQMLFTLKHELAHVWLYENGHTYQDEEKRFTYEDICEFIALSNNSINNVVDLYLKSILMLSL